MTNKSGNLETLLGGVDFTTIEPAHTASDPDWAVVEPVAPLGPQNVESVAPVWDGPIKEAPQTPESLFDSTFDEQVLSAVVARAPEYKDLAGRFDPFELDRMRSMIEGSSYSTFLKRLVYTFEDALAHSIQLCHFWAEEDADAEEARLKEEALRPQPKSEPLVGDKEVRLEMARMRWKTAIETRKRILAEQDAIVAEARIAYQQEKLGR